MVISVILFISGLFITICLVRYSCLLNQSSLELSNANVVQSQLSPSTQMQTISSSIPMTNNFQSENEITIKEKEPSISVSQTSSLLPTSKVSFEHEKFISDAFFRESGPYYDYDNFLQLGSIFIDRPLGIAMQPLDNMGPILMKFNMSEQHWIRRNDE